MMGVLPMEHAGAAFIESEAQDLAYQNSNIFRKNTTLSEQEWKAIHDYYVSNAPEQLPSSVMPDLDKNLSQFKSIFPDYYLSPPSTTMARFTSNGILIGDAHSQQIFHFNTDLNMTRRASVGEGVVWFNQIPEGKILTCMGQFSPTDRPLGSVVFFPESGGPPLTLLDSLRRPVHTEVADLDGDGRFDLVTCEFGKWTGSLSWWKNNGKGQFEQRVLRNMPGAIRSQIADLNGDGLPDVIALFGQGDEGIFIFYNQGNGNFQHECVLRFPPSYGSSFFALTDYNSDGQLDILYTSGDNADYPPVVKPYHGIRIFQNNGNNRFSEVLFLPLPGAYGAALADFDLDGDLDIAAISFFPDFQKMPAAGFVYFENLGNGSMKASTFTSVEKGRWLVMDTGDLNSDGYPDIVLGSLAFEVVPEGGQVGKWVKDGIPFVVLMNRGK